MGKFAQISTELWPLICLKISFPLFCAFIDQFSSNFVQYNVVHIRKEWFGIYAFYL